MNPQLLVGVGTFLVVVLAIEGLYYGWRAFSASEARRLKRRLVRLSAADAGASPTNIERRTIYSDVPWFNRVLERLSPARRLTVLLEQANAPYPLGFYLLLAALLASLPVLLGFLRVISPVLAAPLAVLGALVPVLLLSARKDQRRRRFEEQLPDALDLIGRSLRAGHSFAAGLGLVASEYPDPIGPEFGKTLEEINFGVGAAEALKKLTQRVDCPDLKYFAVAVIVQRETGGNLAEIIDRISHIIRERFRLLGKVRALSAEGRLSAVILCALPFFVAGTLMVLNPEYLSQLYQDRIGLYLLAVAGALMLVGILVMRKMVNFRV